MKKRNDLILNALLVVLSISITLGAAEAAFRVGLVEGSTFQYHKVEHCKKTKGGYSFHSNYGWTMSPNSVIAESQSRQDDWNLYTHNQKGFRDTFDSGSSNVVVLGDSFTYGHLANERSQYPYLLDRWSDKTAFHNYGMRAYGTGQELAVYKDVSKELDHDLVILGYYFGNDPLDNVNPKPLFANYTRPQYAMREGEPILVSAPKKVGNSTNEESGPALRDIHLFLRKNSFTYNWIYVRGRPLLVNLGLLSPYEYPEGSKLKKQITLTSALVNDISEIAGRNDADVLIVTIPQRSEVRQNWSNPDNSNTRQFWETQRAMLHRLSENNSNIKLLKTKPVLKRAAKNERLYGVYDPHLDDYGHRVIGQKIHKWLIEHGYVNASENLDLSRLYDNASQCMELSS